MSRKGSSRCFSPVLICVFIFIYFFVLQPTRVRAHFCGHTKFWPKINRPCYRKSLSSTTQNKQLNVFLRLRRIILVTALKRQLIHNNNNRLQYFPPKCSAIPILLVFGWFCCFFFVVLSICLLSNVTRSKWIKSNC